MFYFRTIKTLYNLTSTAVKLATAYKVVSKAVDLVPAETREKLFKGFSELGDKTQENMLKLLEKHAPGMVEKLVERNKGEQLTKEDLAEAMAQILAQGKTPAAAPKAAPAPAAPAAAAPKTPKPAAKKRAARPRTPAGAA